MIHMSIRENEVSIATALASLRTLLRTADHVNTACLIAYTGRKDAYISITLMIDASGKITERYGMWTDTGIPAE